MEYFYYVSYIYCDGFNTMYANAEISYTKKIKSITEIIEAAESIAKENGLKHAPTIMFYQLLRKESKDNGITKENH